MIPAAFTIRNASGAVLSLITPSAHYAKKRLAKGIRIMAVSVDITRICMKKPCATEPRRYPYANGRQEKEATEKGTELFTGQTDRLWPISALHDRQLSASRVRSKASRELGAFSTGAGIYPARSTEGDSYSC